MSFYIPLISKFGYNLLILIMNSYLIYTASTIVHFQQIIELQLQSLLSTLTDYEAKTEGFVTLQHTSKQLAEMNVPYPHIICMDGDDLVGYTLVMLKLFKEAFPVIAPVIDIINELSYNKKCLGDSKYFIMGQVCIAKKARGQGIFKKLYDRLEEQMKSDFDYVITVISNQNKRSLRAHEKVGFETIKIDTSQGRDWIIVLKQLNKKI